MWVVRIVPDGLPSIFNSDALVHKGMFIIPHIIFNNLNTCNRIHVIPIKYRKPTIALDAGKTQYNP
jgi:hypothetical protein